jgi:hypothetical protein
MQAQEHASSNSSRDEIILDKAGKHSEAKLIGLLEILTV